MRLFVLAFTFLVYSCSSDSQKRYNAEQRLSEFDEIDVYGLKVDNSYLFTDLEDFVSSFGLPDSVLIGKKTVPIKSKEEIYKVFKSAEHTKTRMLLYKGMSLENEDEFVVANHIDFRKAKRTVKYGNRSFSESYTLNQLKEDIPTSVTNSFKMKKSFFEITTGEAGEEYKSYLLKRKSKANPREVLFVEFTFKSNNLIFISFVNYS